MPTPERRAVATVAADVQRERVEWLSPGRVPLRMVTVLSGYGGLGKSQWTALLAAENAGFTLIATAEDSPSATVRPRLEAVGADLERVAFVSIQTDDGFEDGLTIPDDIDTLHELVIDHAANLLIVDPLVAHLPGDIDSHKDQSVSGARPALSARGGMRLRSGVRHASQQGARAGAFGSSERFRRLRELRAKRSPARPRPGRPGRRAGKSARPRPREVEHRQGSKQLAVRDRTDPASEC